MPSTDKLQGHYVEAAVPYKSGVFIPRRDFPCMVPASGRHPQRLPYILLSTVIMIMKKLQQTLIVVPAGY